MINLRFLYMFILENIRSLVEEDMIYAIYIVLEKLKTFGK